MVIMSLQKSSSTYQSLLWDASQMSYEVHEC